MNFIKKLLSRHRSNSASIAKERLQIIVSHERNPSSKDYLPLLQRDLIAVIAKYIDIDEDKVVVALARKDNFSVLELNIALPG